MTDEQRSRPGWIGRENDRVISLRALTPDWSTVTPWRPDFRFTVSPIARCPPSCSGLRPACRSAASFVSSTLPRLAQGHGELSYESFRWLVARAAGFLQAAHIGPGERVLLLAENSPEWLAVALAAQFAARRAGRALRESSQPTPAEEIARGSAARRSTSPAEAQWRKLAPAAGDLVAGGLRAVLSHSAARGGRYPSGLTVADGGDVLGAGGQMLALGTLRGAGRRRDAKTIPSCSSSPAAPPAARREFGSRQRSIVSAIDCGAAGCETTEDDLGLHLLPFGHIAGHDQLCLALAQGHGLIMIARGRRAARPGARPDLRLLGAADLRAHALAGPRPRWPPCQAPLGALVKGAWRLGSACGSTGRARFAIASSPRWRIGLVGRRVGPPAGRSDARPLLRWCAGRAGALPLLRGAGASPSSSSTA